MSGIVLALCAIAVALLALAINVGRLVDVLRMPRARARMPQDAPARSDGPTPRTRPICTCSAHHDASKGHLPGCMLGGAPGYPPPPDSTSAFYVPPGRTE